MLLRQRGRRRWSVLLLPRASFCNPSRLQCRLTPLCGQALLLVLLLFLRYSCSCSTSAFALLLNTSFCRSSTIRSS
jgi:hypothetical protein